MSGVHLSQFQRDGIYRWTMDGRSAEELYFDFFGGKGVSLQHIKNRMRFFETASAVDVATYLIPDTTNRETKGPKRKIDAVDDLLVKFAMDEVNTKRLWSILSTFAAMKGIDTSEISISSIYRSQLRVRYSYKMLTRLHIRQNPIEAMAFFDSVVHINPDFILNFDAASSESGENFKEKRGTAAVGEEAV